MASLGVSELRKGSVGTGTQTSEEAALAASVDIRKSATWIQLLPQEGTAAAGGKGQEGCPHGIRKLTGNPRKPTGSQQAQRKKQVASSSPSLESSSGTSYGWSLTGSSWQSRNVVCRAPAPAPASG